MQNYLTSIRKELGKYASKEKADFYPYFFKTGKGQYGEGDKFLGVTVPHIRKITKQFKNAPIEIIEELLASKYHEERLLSLLILVEQYERGSEKQKETIYNYYLNNATKINNWDLVDLSAYKIVGAHLFHKNRDILLKLAKSTLLWERRIAIISTFYFIKNNDFKTTIEVSKLLVNDKHDLIHKAVGWMLREVGKRDKDTEVVFLSTYYKQMPRTMLRYAIEKFPETERLKYLKGEM